MYDINNSLFKYPIEYLKNKKKTNVNIIDDLELLNTKDDISFPLLNIIFKPKTIYGKKFLYKTSNYYTNDKKYLSDSQKILIDISKKDLLDNFEETTEKMNHMWETIKNDEGFLENFYYIEYEYFKFLNNSSSFLQILSTYNLLSPILTLIMPILMLIVPFFMLKIGKIPITFSIYIEVLKKVLMQNPIFKLFTLDSNVSLNARLYALFSCLFYCFSLYNSANTCYRFYKNYNKIHDHINILKKYIFLTAKNMDNILKITNKYSSYSEFNESIDNNKKMLLTKFNELNKIAKLKYSPNNMVEIGYVMKMYYQLYNDKILDDVILYSFGFNGYFDQMIGLSEKYKNKQINICKFNNKNIMKNMYYPPLIDKNPVKNDINFKKNIIITGPNASGKTTILKSTLINILLSQIYGVGFYEKASITLYDNLHCYLNIPDTSGRDSLFQAEARRCRDIITQINIKSKEKHFCIFDELYSGTNPYEAIASASSFVNYLSKFNIKFLLTTHYIQLCELKNKNIVNYYMKTIPLNKYDFKYSYLIEKGISKIKGGLKVLVDLEYPEEILINAHKILKNI